MTDARRRPQQGGPGQPRARSSAASRATPTSGGGTPGRAAGAFRGRGLTTRGRCLLAGGCAAILCAILLDERDLLRVGILAVALPVVAATVVIGRRVRVRVRHHVTPARLHPGSTGSVRLSVTNRNQIRTPPVVLVDAAIDGLAAGARCRLPPLRPGATATVRYPLHATRRGRFAFESVAVQISDPFGLCTSIRTVASHTDVLIVPLVVPLVGLPLAAGARSAASGVTAGGTSGGEPDVVVRPYLPGDDIRTVHWRATARRDELMVRTREWVSHGDITVLLDHRIDAHQGQGADSSLEVAVALAASVSLHLLSHDYQMQLSGHTGDVIASGNDVIDDVLIGLAELAADPGYSFDMQTAARPGLLIAILGAVDAQQVRTLTAARPRGSRTVALLVDPAGWDDGARSAMLSGALPAGEAAARFSAAGWNAAVLHRGDDFAATWQSLCVGASSLRRSP